ncbi:replicative DNA helicase, partial [Planctomycetota bacterium]
MQVSDKLFSKASEAAVLGSMIVDPQCIPTVTEWLERDSFFLPEHQTIFDAILTVWKQNPKFDGLLVRTELENRNQLQEIGGLSYLQKVVDSAPTAANAVHYAKVVAEKKRYRGLVESVEKMDKALEKAITVDEQIEQIQGLALSLDCNPVSTEVFTAVDHATNVAIATQDHREIISTGFRNIDSIIGGIEPGQLIVTAARPSMGKTALALDVALDIAKSGKSIVFFTLEMSHQSLIERACCSLGCVNLADIKCDCPTQSNLDQFYAASLELAKYPLTIHEGGATPEKQLAFIRKWKQAHGVDLVVVDYLQLMNG